MNLRNGSRFLALGGVFSLITVLVLWYGYPAPGWGLLLVVPLLFPLHGLIKGKPYTHAWSSFLVLGYFTHGVVEAWSNDTVRLWASLEIVSSVVTYSGVILYARLQSRWLKQQVQSSP